MRTRLFVLAYFCAIGFAASARAQECCTAAPAGLKDWWTGDFNARDLVGAHNGTLVGDAAIYAGFVGDGFLFHSEGDAVTFGSAGQFGTADFTIDFWVQIGSGSAGGLTLMEKREACGFGSFWGMRVESSGVVHAELDATSGPYVSFDGATDIADGSYHHVALVRKGTKLSLYVDGKLDGSQTSAAVVNISNSALFTVGTGVCDPAPEGTIDEIQVFNHALSAAQIQSIYDAASAGLCK